MQFRQSPLAMRSIGSAAIRFGLLPAFRRMPGYFLHCFVIHKPT
ncbi:hypothetical protein [Paenibacillus dendritiformis]|nr:hypothetical protein [Paenibacillus dendritiformis]